jgi:hypothetical protein
MKYSGKMEGTGCLLKPETERVFCVLFKEQIGLSMREALITKLLH